MLLDRWDNIDSLRDYNGPVEIYGARDDNLIACDHARNLARNISYANFQEIACGHNDWSSMAEVNIKR